MRDNDGHRSTQQANDFLVLLYHQLVRDRHIRSSFSADEVSQSDELQPGPTIHT